MYRKKKKILEEKRKSSRNQNCTTYHIEMSPKIVSQDAIKLSPVCRRNPLIPLTPRINLRRLTESNNLIRGKKVVRNLFSNIEAETDLSSNVTEPKVRNAVDIENYSTDLSQDQFDEVEDFSDDDSLLDKNYTPDYALTSSTSSSSDENYEDDLEKNDISVSANLYDNNGNNFQEQSSYISSSLLNQSPTLNLAENATQMTTKLVSALNESVANVNRYIKSTNLLNDDGNSAEKNILVNPCRGKRSDKKQSCLYCKKMVIKLPRHLQSKHSNELKVIEFSKLAVNSKERKKVIEEIRNLGNFIHNTNTIGGNNSGELIVKRRPSKQEKMFSFYLPCQYCYASFSKNLLFKHMKVCKSRTSNEKPKWKRVQSTSSMMLPILTDASISLRENVLNIMKTDTITDIAKNDKLILLFGSKLCTKYASEKHLNTLISCKMRELSRLLIEIRRQEPNLKNLTEILQPKYFSLLVKCVHSISGYDSNSGRFKIPSLAKKLGHSLKMCANIWLSECLKLRLTEQQKKVENFSKMFDLEWNINISRSAVNTLYEGSWNKTDDLLPLSEDIQNINFYLIEQISVLKTVLNSNFDLQAWRKLMKIVLCSLILFNRRRVGEVQRLTLEHFNLRRSISKDSEVFKLLTVLEKKIAERFKHVEIRGKRGRKVPLLISLENEEILELLIKHRLKAGVSQNNPFVFGILKTSFFRGVDAMRFAAKECGAKNPQNLTSTKLRKHIATSIQLLNLKENELDYIANYMGHDIRIHRQYYRLPDNAIHLGKISKLLLSMENGTIENQGKSLDQLHNINLPRTVEEEEYVEPAVDASINLPVYNNNITAKNIQPKSNSRKAIRRYWSNLEVNAVKRHLNHYIETKEIPGRNACLQCKISEQDLKSRSWLHIKSWVHNQITKKNRN